MNTQLLRDKLLNIVTNQRKEIETSPNDTLYGKYPDADFLTELEAEHKQEIAKGLKRK